MGDEARVFKRQVKKENNQGGGMDISDTDTDFFFFFFDSTVSHMGSLFSDQGLNLSPLQRKHITLTTGPPGNSQGSQFSMKISSQIQVHAVGVKCFSGRDSRGYLFNDNQLDVST